MRILLIVACIIVTAGCYTKPDFVRQAEKERQPLLVITDYGTTWPDSSGAVDFHVTLFNTSARAIQSIDLDVETFNLAGEAALDEKSGQSLYTLTLKGPLASGQSNVHPLTGSVTKWRQVWYNHNIACAKIQAVSIIYMNGDIRKFPQPDALIPNNGCRRTY